MAERINLAQFDIDTRLIEEKVAQNQSKIGLLRGEVNDTKKSIKQYQDAAKLLAGTITANNERQEHANNELQQGIITQDQYNEIIAETSRVIRQSETELSSLITLEREQQQQLVRAQQQIRAFNDENRELNNLLRAGRTELTGSEGEYRRLSNELAATRQEANNLGAQLRQLEQDGQRNTAEYNRLNEQWRQSSERARGLHDELLELDRATGDNRRNVGNYTESIKEAFASIGTGFTQIITGNVFQGFQTIKSSFGEIKTAARELWVELMANPLIALAAAIAAIGVGLYNGAKAVFEYNAEVSKLNKEIEGLTNLTGSVVDRLREYATALESMYGKEFKESIQEMNSLMKDFGLTSEQAFKVYNEGLAKGGATNSEFGDSIREYGVLFAQNGYSAKEFIDLLNAGIDLDVYSDKLPDAIKEAGLALNEQTKATRDALINAFGQTFSDDLLKRIRSGQTTVKQAVDEISIQAQKVGLNTQQIAQLNADVFKGAGEDAGGLLKIMEAVNLANSKDAQTLTKTQEATIQLADANVELEKAKTKALKSDDVQAFSKNIDLATTQIETGFYKVIEKLKDGVIWFDIITGSSELIAEVWQTGTDYLRQLWKALEGVTAIFGDLADALGLNNSGSESFLKTVLKTLNPLNLLKGLYSALTFGIKAFVNILEVSRVNITAFAIAAKNLFGQIAAVAISLANMDFNGALERIKNFSITSELKKARAEAEKIVALNKAAKAVGDKEDVSTSSSKIKSNDKNTGASADAAAKAEAERKKLLEKQQKEADAAKKKADAALDKAAKEDLANAKERANVAIQATQAELAEYITMNAEKLKSDKRLTQVRVDEVKKYLEDIREKTQIANDLEKAQKIQSLNDQLEAIKGASQQELDQKKNLTSQKEVVEKEYGTKSILINNEANEKIKEVEKTFLEQKREMRNLATALEYQQRLLDLENVGATEFEIQKTQLEQETEQRLAAFLEESELKRELDQENYDLNAEIEAQRREIENEIAIEQDEIKKQRLQNLLSSLNIISQDYASKDVKINQEKEMSKWNLAASVAGGMAKIAGEQTRAGKAMAIAQATINAIAGSIRALADYPAPYSYILMGTTIATGLAQVAKIAGVDTGGAEAGFAGISSAISTYAPKKTPNKAAKGMIAKGRSHDSGGVDAITPNGLVEIEGGEAVINKKSTAMFYDVLSEINQLGGGVKFAGGFSGGANITRLPTVQNTFKSAIDMDMLGGILKDYIIEGSAIGTHSGSKQGIVSLSENREIQRGANF